MTYKEKFVTVIKNNGRILRDVNGAVRIPFGSEYSIYMKNLHSRKAVVSVSIDGDDTLDGNRIVLGAGGTTELKGFMKDNAVKNRFRFINKTEEIVEHRGDRIDDGVVRIEFRFERELPVVVPMVTNHIFPYSGPSTDWSYRNNNSSGCISASGATYGASNCFFSQTKSCAPKPDEGITVAGSLTNQQFYYTSVGDLEPVSGVIVLRLKGSTTRGKKVMRPITTKTKITCPTCGRSWKSAMKYCGNCSTYIG